MIGAGSVVFSKKLAGDILSFPEFTSATLSFMDIDPERLAVGAALCGKVAKAIGASPRIEQTLELSAALDGADFVINMAQVGGFDATLVDFEIPRKYGLSFTIADTTGPGGLFRALRTYPMLMNLCRQMRERCPKALLLNYSNPMSMNMRTIDAAGGVSAIGLCHSVQGTLCDIMGYIGERPGDVAFTCAGINHMAFYLRLEKQGQDLYPRLFEAMKSPRVYNANRVRFELLKRLGFFVTESSEHNAEYSPWFLGHGPMHAARFNVPIDEYLRRCDASAEEFSRLRESSQNDSPVAVRPSNEYGSTIIHAMTTGVPAVVYGNLPNRGAIPNLPPGAIAEAPTLVDRSGPRLTMVGELPPQLVGYIQPHVTQHELFIRAATKGSRDCVYQAAMFDPLTSSQLTLDQIVQLCDELIAAHGLSRDGGLLPTLDLGRRVISTPASVTPSSTARDAAARLPAGADLNRAEVVPCPDPSTLRQRWRSAQTAAHACYIRQWHVIGPFPAGEGNRAGLDLPTELESHVLSAEGQGVDLRRVHDNGGRRLTWQPATAGGNGLVDLAQSLGHAEWSVAYACAEFTSTATQQVILRSGSDDGIKIWVNGALVHEHEVGRAYRHDSDRALATLIAGINRIFVKIDNYTGGWGFGVAVVELQTGQMA